VTGAGGVPGSSDVTAAVMVVTVTDPSATSFVTVYPAGRARPFISNLNFVPGQTVANLVEVGVGIGGKVTVYNLAGSTDVVADVQGYVTQSVFGTAGYLNSQSPARITDTRAGSGEPNAGEQLGPGGVLQVQVTGAGGVPSSGVGAVVLNVTATDTSDSSWLTVYPAGSSRPLASDINFVRGQTVADRVVVPVGSGGKVNVYNFRGNTDVVLDVGGWFTDGSQPPEGALFTPLNPARVVDTRANSGFAYTGQSLGPGSSAKYQLSGRGGVPAMSSSSPPRAVVLNVTATNTTAGSWFTVYPSDAARPLASDLNWAAGQTLPNLVIARLGADGAIEVYNFAGSSDIVIDVFGWYS
jgi:hypothetical protein